MHCNTVVDTKEFNISRPVGEQKSQRDHTEMTTSPKKAATTRNQAMQLG